MTNIEELVAARDDPHSFVEKLALSTKPAVKKAALERERAAKKQATKLLSKEKKAAPLNPALIPAQYKMLYVLFFDSASKLNMVAIIKEVAKEFFGVVKNSAKVQLRRLPVFAPPAPMQRLALPNGKPRAQVLAASLPDRDGRHKRHQHDDHGSRLQAAAAPLQAGQEPSPGPTDSARPAPAGWLNEGAAYADAWRPLEKSASSDCSPARAAYRRTCSHVMPSLSGAYIWSIR
eukprot:6500559-Prymnesium_polylepis.1